MVVFGRRKLWICGLASAMLGTAIYDAQADGTNPLKERPALPTAFTAETLGALVYASALNNNGDITGSIAGNELGKTRAFLWSHGKLTDIGGSSKTVLLNGLAINDRQQIIGGAVPDSKEIIPYPAIYENGITSDLRKLPGGKDIVKVASIDHHGRIIGMNAAGDTRILSDGHWDKISVPDGWVPNTHTDYHGQIIPGDVSIAMNDQGDMAGVFGNKKKKRAIEAIVNGVTYPIAPPPGAVGFDLKGISETGVVAGNGFTHRPKLKVIADDKYAKEPSITLGDVYPMDGAFMWTVAGGTQTLPVLDGFATAAVSAISPNGDIIGTSRDAKGKRCLTLWRDGKATAIRDLPPALLEAHDIEPIDINDKDQVCVMTGDAEVSDDMQEAMYYLLSPK